MACTRRIILGLALITVTPAFLGCDVIFNLFPTTNDETGKSQLLPFASEKELDDYLRDQVNSRNERLNTFNRQFEEVVAVDTSGEGAVGGDGAAPSAPGTGNGGLASDDADSGPDFSETTTQEVGVDEADVVKTDGDYLYVLTTEWPDSVLRIVDLSDHANMVEVARVDIEGGGQDFYLYGDTVVALTSRGGGFFYFGGGGGIAVDAPAIDDDGSVDAVAPDGNSATEPVSVDGTDGTEPDESDREPATDSDVGLLPSDYVYDRPTLSVTVIDVADRTAPAVSSVTRFDGSIASSRMIDGVLHLVAANFENYYYDVLPLLGSPDLNPSTVDAAEMLPSYTRISADGTETTGDVITWEALYRPTDPDGFGVVYVASIDIDADAAFTAVGVVAEPGLIYSSRQALYLTDTEYDFSGGQRSTTDVYKFAYVERGAVPVATGSVQGRVLNQYSMGEHQGNLRVATTIDATFGPFGQQTPASNRVYVLEEREGSLSILGSIEGIAPRETIQAARFIGDKGFVVTFEQIDPLFTLDLSDPANPRVVGELKVPGFSTFLVPIDEDHLLAVGQHVPPPGEFGSWGVQLSIFDVTDFAQPLLMDSVIIGDETGAYSEAIHNPKAFTYFAERGTVALPISIYDNFFGFEDGVVVADGDDAVDTSDSGDGSSGSSGGADAVPPDDGMVDEPMDSEPIDAAPYVPEGFSGLAVYNVSVETGLTEIGRISTRFPEAGIYWSSFTRGVFVGDDVLAVTDRGVRGAVVADIDTDQFELLFDRSSDQDSGGDEPPPADAK